MCRLRFYWNLWTHVLSLWNSYGDLKSIQKELVRQLVTRRNVSATILLKLVDSCLVALKFTQWPKVNTKATGQTISYTMQCVGYDSIETCGLMSCRFEVHTVTWSQYKRNWSDNWLHDAMCRLRFYWNLWTHVLSFWNSHSDLTSIQKELVRQFHRMIKNLWI